MNKTFPSPSDLLPHRETALKILTIDSFDEKLIICTLIKTEPSHASVALEYIAQAGGLIGGILTGQVKPGMIVAVKNFNAKTKYFNTTHDPLLVRANIIGESTNACIVAGTVFRAYNAEILAEAQVTIAYR